MSETKTPRTDALIGKVTAGMNEPDDSEIVWLIDHARQLETELSAEQQARVAAEIALRAWHSIFGTTQLSHAHAGFEAATERAERAEARAQELEKDAERYRWLREASSTGKQTRAQEIMFARYYPYDDIDAAIDAAQRKEG